MKDIDLWNRLEASQFPLQQGNTDLSQLLDSKTRLSPRKVGKLMREYRRFLYLAARGSLAVPSRVIDRVWHMHIEDTRAYQSFCAEVIGQFVHHTPGRPAQLEDPAYADTLRIYESEFGEKPDWRIWPVTADRWAATFILGGGAVFLLSAFAAANFQSPLFFFGFPTGAGLMSLGAYLSPWALRFQEATGGCGGSCSGDGGGGDGGGCGGGGD